ncbi:MAG: hypothetical protein AAF939_19705 [Planctomycetota bacterium]
MKLRLLTSCPGKRFDNEPRLCVDGRGGWQLSQINTDRWISDYEGYFLIFCFAVLATNAAEKDFVEKTRVTGRMRNEVIGTSELQWKSPNEMWLVMDGEAIFEWVQKIDLRPTEDGLITFTIDVKLHSQTNWIEVNGYGYTRIKNVGEMPQLEWRWTKSFFYPLVRLIPKRYRRSKTEW